LLGKQDVYVVMEDISAFAECVGEGRFEADYEVEEYVSNLSDRHVNIGIRFFIIYDRKRYYKYMLPK
jgi:hypothetical protein